MILVLLIFILMFSIYMIFIWIYWRNQLYIAIVVAREQVVIKCDLYVGAILRLSADVINILYGFRRVTFCLIGLSI